MEHLDFFGLACCLQGLSAQHSCLLLSDSPRHVYLPLLFRWQTQSQVWGHRAQGCYQHVLPFLSGGRSRLYGDGHVVLSQSAIKMLHKQAAVFLTVHQTKQMQVHRPCFPGCGPQTDEGARQTCRMPALTHTHAPEPCRANSHLVCLPILSNPTDELSFRFWAAE